MKRQVIPRKLIASCRTQEALVSLAMKHGLPEQSAHLFAVNTLRARDARDFIMQQHPYLPAKARAALVRKVLRG